MFSSLSPLCLPCPLSSLPSLLQTLGAALDYELTEALFCL